MQAALEFGIVHVGLPDQQGERLAVAGADGQLLIREHGGLHRILHGIMVHELRHVGRGHDIDVGNVELVGRASLDPNGADEHHLAEALGGLGHHFRRDPATHGAGDDIDLGEAHLVHQLQIDMGDVVHMVDPVGQLRAAKTGMGGRDDAAMGGQQRHIGIFRIEASARVQKEQRRA